MDGWLTAAVNSRVSVAWIGLGSAGGASTPNQWCSTMLGTPLSSNVGTSGCDGCRCAVVTPTGRKRPDCTNATAAGIEVKTAFISPPTVAVTAGPAPL